MVTDFSSITDLVLDLVPVIVILMLVKMIFGMFKDFSF
jgi:hypothetical protein